ncbi:hypothetical protein [Nonomuraea sp. GTA35]|uniref:hypothetical protein n=1 Tax=Nonomuraea sp. GTA35 TaxID=1676746 RepID=UPI0035BF989A
MKVAVATRTAEKGAVLKLATGRGAVPLRAAGKLATANVSVPERATAAVDRRGVMVAVWLVLPSGLVAGFRRDRYSPDLSSAILTFHG